MKITTQDMFSDQKIKKTLGLVKGNTVRARNIGTDLLAGLRGIIGGEVGGYTKLLMQTREQAVKRMLDEADEIGADGIVCVRITTSNVARGMIEIVAYGTAVKLS
ncbi:MAG: YbjQ family protein [Alphaproteobacteria bacterium]|jgi:uncharacterized protein YbjQ (UPF0145 family)|nr:YbjQ family protein [Alphaproteobacteria bacterium]MBT5389958.1 YbjQ family protein [Alphaproteobacteria bacterium]MBT5541148.1 YbjQ family protein [Alphaproteobacteria bacterium]MBT5653941.1 YbjQ family protein [Alphaproteobacteria bacterium]